MLRTGGVYVCISSLESTKLAFAPPRWAQGEWGHEYECEGAAPAWEFRAGARKLLVHAAVKVG